MRAARALLSLGLALGLLGGSPPLSGHFALQTGDARTRAYLHARPAGRDPLVQRLDVWFTRGSSQTVRRFDVDMTKYLHLVAVSDDFSIFLHLHPALFRDGHFRLEQRFPKAAIYHVYADGEPHGIGQQVFRFDVAAGISEATRRRTLAPPQNIVRVGRYSVALETTRLRTNVENVIAVHVREGAGPALRLEPYLGAPAHAVFLCARDLTYVHVHPMALGAPSTAMGGMIMSSKASPDMVLHVAVRERGSYELWLEFRAAGALYVAPFTITAT